MVDNKKKPIKDLTNVEKDYILEESKPIKKKVPIINLVAIPKYQPTDFKLPEPDPQTKALEENFNRIRKETEDEKRRMRTSGLAGLMGGDNE